MRNLDRLFWIVLRRFWPSWSGALILVKPGTVVYWYRAGFEWFWRWQWRPRHPGRPAISGEIRQLIRRMKAENPTWGAPRIHGELPHLGFAISEPTVSRDLLRLKTIVIQKKQSAGSPSRTITEKSSRPSNSSPCPR